MEGGENGAVERGEQYELGSPKQEASRILISWEVSLLRRQTLKRYMPKPIPELEFVNYDFVRLDDHQSV
jgi:hypothetical protein